MSKLTAHEQYLVHQIHPAKLATDISASIVSEVLFWRHRLVPGLLILLAPPLVVSSILLRRDLDAYRDSPAARYVLHHMPTSMQAVRAASALVAAIGAWQRSPGLVGVGYVLALLGWSHGLLPGQCGR